MVNDRKAGTIIKPMEMQKCKKLNIAMLGHKHIPSREGGIEVVVEELSTRMVALGHEVICYNRSGHHISGVEFDKNVGNRYKGIKLKELFTINKKGLAAMTSSIFGAFCTALGKYDVVHFHAEGTCVMLWLPKLFGKRCIVSVHGLDHQRIKWGKFASAYIMMGEKCAVKFADEIIVLSKGVQDYFKETYGRETKFIPNGVNKPVIREARIIRDKWKLDKDSYILFLGRLVPEKGLRYLIEAYKDLVTDKHLVIAGGSSDTEAFVNELKAVCKENGKVIFTGFVQGEVLDELYSNSYVYVLPSDLEGMPLSLLEAMSYGNCCIVSDIDECQSVITGVDGSKKAVVFKKSNIMELKNKLQMLCDDKNMVYSYKADAAEFICKKYAWDDVVKRTLDLYKKR